MTEENEMPVMEVRPLQEDENGMNVIAGKWYLDRFCEMVMATWLAGMDAICEGPIYFKRVIGEVERKLLEERQWTNAADGLDGPPTLIIENDHTISLLGKDE